MPETALPSKPTKTNSDGTGDDPALALLTDLAGVIDAVGTIIDNLAFLHGAAGSKEAARTNLGLKAQALDDGANIQKQLYTYWPDTGSANSLVITPTPALVAYAPGIRLTVKVAATVASGGAVINVGALGEIAIKRPDGQDPAVGQILANQIIEGVLHYTGSVYQFIVVSALAGSGLKAARLTYEVSSGVNGPNYTGFSWEDILLNTASDPDNIAPLDTNAFTPVSGTYQLNAGNSARGSSSAAREWTMRIHNVTDDTPVAKSGVSNSTSGGAGGGGNEMSCFLTTDGTKTFKAQLFADAGIVGATALSTGDAEVYNYVSLLKIA